MNRIHTASRHFDAKENATPHSLGIGVDPTLELPEADVAQKE
jgi:hypothetical protein